MAATALALLRKRIHTVRRRLFWQSMIGHIIWCQVGVLLLVAVWFLVQPLVLGVLGPEVRWFVLAGGVGVGVLLGIALAAWRAPSKMAAALLLDEKFGLKERVTTTLLLTEEQAQSPAGQALLADVATHIQSLKVRTRFPVQVSWKRLLFPIGAGAVAVLALFFEPDVRRWDPNGPGNNNATAAEISEVKLKRQQDMLKKKLAEKKKKLSAKKLKELEEIVADWEKIVDQKIDPKDRDRLRKQAEQLQNLEAKLNDRIEDLAALKEQKLKVEEQLEDLKQLAPEEPPQDGPAKDMQEAIQKGDLKKAQDEVENLQKKLAKNELNENEKKKLEQQLQDMEKQLQKEAEQRERKQEQLQRELEQLEQQQQQAKKTGKPQDEQQQKQNAAQQQAIKQQMQQLRQMKNVQQQMRECKNCLQQGDGKKLDENLKKLAGQMKELAEQQQQLEQQLENLKQAERDQQQLQQDQQLVQQMRQNLVRQLNHPNRRTGGAGGIRRKGKEEKTNNFNARQKGELDPDGKLQKIGVTRGGSFKKIPAEKVQGTFQRIDQDVQRAIETQRITPEAAEMLKGYYQNLGGQKK